MGWYDGNPAHLVPIGPADQARRYIDAMGGREHVFGLATKAQESGDDVWAVQLLNHLVMNDAQDQSARNALRSEEHTSELQSLMRISYAVFCLKKKTQKH